MSTDSSNSRPSYRLTKLPAKLAAWSAFWHPARFSPPMLTHRTLSTAPSASRREIALGAQVRNPRAGGRGDSAPEQAPKPPKPSKLGEGILTAIFGFLLYGIPPIIASLFIVLAAIVLQLSFGMSESWIDATAGQFSFIVLTEALAIGLVVLLLKFTRETWRSIGVLKPQAKSIGYMFLAFAGYYVAYIILAVVASSLLPIDVEQEQELGFQTGVVGIELFMVFASLVVLAPLVEEIIFRGFLYTRFRRSFSVIWSAVFVSVLFAIGHLQLGSGNTPLWVAAIDTFVLSIVLVWLREKTGNIWAGMGVHALKNGLAFFLLFVLQI